MTSAHETSTGDELLTPAQARRRIGVSHRTFQRYRAAGRITPARITPTGHARFRVADVDALDAAPPPDAAELDAGAVRLSWPLLVSLTLSAFLASAALPAGVSVFVLFLAGAVGVGTRIGLAKLLEAHAAGRARLAAARHRDDMLRARAALTSSMERHPAGSLR